MGVFADAMEAAAAETQDPGSTDQGQTQTESSPDSSTATRAIPGAAPSTPSQTSPSNVNPSQPGTPRTPAQPARPGGDVAQGKQVDLRALHEARAETKSWKDAYGWLPREEAPHVRQFMTAYKSDPAGTLMGELDARLNDPQDRQRIVGWLQQRGLIAGSANGHTQVRGQGQDDPEPQPDFRLADGTSFMSAERLAEWRAWHARQDDKRLNEKLQPLQEFVTTSQRSAAHAAVVEKANRFAEDVFSEAKQWPYFTENQAAIAAKYSEVSKNMPAQAALYRAYVDVLQASVFPTLSRTEREKAAADLKARTRATTPNPTRPTGAHGDRRPESFRDAAERILGHSGAR